MNEKVAAVVEQIKAKYANVDTILLFGSAASADWAPASDIDIFLIDSKFNDEREDIVVDGIAVEIQEDSFANIAKDVEAERGQLLHRNVATMLAEAQIIATKSPAQLEALKALADDVLASKSKYTDEDVKMWQYSIEDYLGKAARDLARGDNIAFYLDTHYVLQNALEMSLATHGAYLPKPRKLAAVLQTTDPAFYQIFLDFASVADSHQKLKILQQLNSHKK